MKRSIRYWLLISSLIIIISGLAVRVISLQVFECSFLRGQGEARTVRVVNIPAHRGMITDRHGEPLAISTPVNSIWLNPKEFDSEHPQLLTLAAVLDISLNQLIEKVKKNSNKEFVYLQRHVAPTVSEQIRMLDVPGIHLKSEYRRYYPTGEVASHIIGFTDIDDHGQEGLEMAYDKWLRGVDGTKKVVKDRLGREVQILQGINEMEPGQNISLSLDQRLQYLAYRELKAAVAARHAEAGSVVVLDVKTGEILAMVNQPSFNPNMRIKIKTDDGRYRNRAVTDVIEPASSMKTFSVVNALQNGTITPTTLVDTSPGWMMVGGHKVKEDKDKNFGVIDVATILQKSSNVGVSKLTLALPSKQLWGTYTDFGFGTSTGSGFPGESGGSLVCPPKQGNFVLATMAFGYGMSVTPLQLAQAYATLGAGGVKRPVTFLKQNGIPEGKQIIEPVIARQVVDMLTSVVEQGSGTKAKVTGYQTAGKTGTSKKISSTGGYQDHCHVSIFAGLAPSSHPRFAIVVVVDDPKGPEYYGSQVAAPIFSRIAGGALRLFNIPPDLVEKQDLRVAQVNETGHHD